MRTVPERFFALRFFVLRGLARRAALRVAEVKWPFLSRLRLDPDFFAISDLFDVLVGFD